MSGPVEMVKLENMVKGTQHQFIQSNGQRIYCPFSWSGIPKPPRGCEIFVGNLPRHLYEDTLIPLFSTIGPIYSFRMMLDFFETSRGFAFVSYHEQGHAFRAVSRFDKFQIGPQSRLVVSISVDNRRLFVGRIPKMVGREEFREIVQVFMDGVVNVHLYEDLQDRKLNRGFAFVEFESHKDAALARKKFAPAGLELWQSSLYVDWAEPLPIIDPEILNKVNILYLNNLPMKLDSDQLNQKLRKVLPESTIAITKTYKHKNYAFVHFSDRVTAEIGFRKLTGLRIWGQYIGIEWARPANLCRLYHNNLSPLETCRSLPRGWSRA